MVLSLSKIHMAFLELLHKTSTLFCSLLFMFRKIKTCSAGWCLSHTLSTTFTVGLLSFLGNTPLMYGCAGGHEEVVKFLLEHGANVEDHNENGHTPLMEAASAGHVGLAKILLEHGAGINTHSNEFKESALTLACYKGHLDMVRFLLEAGADQVKIF